MVPAVQKALICDKPGPDYELRLDSNYPVPEPKPDEVLVKLTSSGVCHSDLSLLTGHWQGLDMQCDVSGHEGVGRIVAHGANVNKEKFPIGLKVGLPLTKTVCHQCESCLTPDGEVYCDNIEFIAITTNGTFQEYSTLASNYLIPIPENLPDKYAGPLLCGGVTVYKGIKKANLQPGDFLVILGAGGGLGSMGIFYAKHAGLRVIAIDTGKDKKDACLEYGAEKFIDFKETPDIGKEVWEYTKRGAHGCVVLPPNKHVYTQALTTLEHSTLVCIGIPGLQDKLEFAPSQAIFNNVKIIGSLVGSRKDLNDCLRIAANKEIKFPVKEYKMEECKEVLDMMARGELTGRAILKYD